MFLQSELEKVLVRGWRFKTSSLTPWNNFYELNFYIVLCAIPYLLQGMVHNNLYVLTYRDAHDNGVFVEVVEIYNKEGLPSSLHCPSMMEDNET